MKVVLFQQSIEFDAICAATTTARETRVLKCEPDASIGTE